MYTYIVTICMVIVLFVLSFAMITNSDDTVVTSTNSISNNTINNESSRLVTKKKMQKITTRIIKICITKKFMAIIKVKLFYN